MPPAGAPPEPPVPPVVPLPPVVPPPPLPLALWVPPVSALPPVLPPLVVPPVELPPEAFAPPVLAPPVALVPPPPVGVPPFEGAPPVDGDCPPLLLGSSDFSEPEQETRTSAGARAIRRAREYVVRAKAPRISPEGEIEHDEERQHAQDRPQNPTNHHPPPGAQRASAAAIAAEADGPRLSAALRQYAAIAADRRTAARTRADGHGTTVFTAGIGGPAMTQKLSGHEPSLARPAPGTDHAPASSDCSRASVPSTIE
jgi:hypothetical protein